MTFLEIDQIETPENVQLERRLAGIGSRFIAGLVDNLILAGFYLVMAFVLWVVLAGATTVPGEIVDTIGAWVLALLLAVAFTVYWGYFVFFELHMQGQTPGKKSAKIRVVRQTGGPITFTDVAIRNLLRVVDGLAFYGVAGVVMFISRRAQRLGDLASGTVVISEQVADYSSRTDRRSIGGWEVAVEAGDLRATGLTAEEFRILQNYWNRRHELSFPARRRLVPKLVRPILERTGQTLDDDSVPTCEDILYALLAKTYATASGRGEQKPKIEGSADERRTVS